MDLEEYKRKIAIMDTYREAPTEPSHLSIDEPEEERLSACSGIIILLVVWAAALGIFVIPFVRWFWKHHF